MNDWWPRMPFMYALQGYYEATNDKRIIPFLLKYFKYQLANLDADPLRDWGKSRAGDNIEIVLWLYNKTGEKYLLSLAEKLKEQAYPWADIFENNQFFYFGKDFQPTHMVNVAEALKFPSVYAQIDQSPSYLNATEDGIKLIMRDNGLPQGLASGTEMLAGKSSVEGVETCAVVEWMQSLETAFRILHEPVMGDQLEKVAFNALPAQFNDDFKNHSYYTLPNQVRSVEGPHGFNQDYVNGIVPSPYSGYPCCRYNMHMGWPYFIKNSWMATPDSGLAVNTYGPMEISTILAGNTKIKITEETNYPFEESIRLHISLSKPLTFPLRLRIPSWCSAPTVVVNEKKMGGVSAGQIFLVSRKWNNGDQVILNFPMHLTISKQVNNGVSIERGPLVYALAIKSTEKDVKKFEVPGFFEKEYSAASPWNYGLLLNQGPPDKVIHVRKSAMPANPFTAQGAPVKLTVEAKRLPSWTMDYNGVSALDVPYGPVQSEEKTEEITLVPFGAETLRLSIFPTIGKPDMEINNYSNRFDDNDVNDLVNYGGYWYCKDNAVQAATNDNSKSGKGIKLIATKTNFSDFEYSADITLTSSGDAGLLFRVSDAAIGENAYKGYYIGLDATQKMIHFGKSANNQWSLIATAQYPLQINDSYNIKVKAVKDNFEIYINNESKPVIVASDKQYSTGSIGVRTNEALVSIDNLQVTSLHDKAKN